MNGRVAAQFFAMATIQIRAFKNEFQNENFCERSIESEDGPEKIVAYFSTLMSFFS